MFFFQVYELHRIYRIQKILMKNTGSSRTNNHEGNMHQQVSRMNLERPADDQMMDENEIELTLGPASARYVQPRKKHGTPPQYPLTSESGPSFSSSNSTESSHMNRGTSSGSKHKTNTTSKDEGLIFQVTDMTLGYQNGSKNNINIDVDQEQLRQSRLKQPPWLYQVLSMNMTWKQNIFQCPKKYIRF